MTVAIIRDKAEHSNVTYYPEVLSSELSVVSWSLLVMTVLRGESTMGNMPRQFPLQRFQISKMLFLGLQHILLSYIAGWCNQCEIISHSSHFLWKMAFVPISSPQLLLLSDLQLANPKGQTLSLLLDPSSDLFSSLRHSVHLPAKALNSPCLSSTLLVL